MRETVWEWKRVIEREREKEDIERSTIYTRRIVNNVNNAKHQMKFNILLCFFIWNISRVVILDSFHLHLFIAFVAFVNLDTILYSKYFLRSLSLSLYSKLYYFCCYFCVVSIFQYTTHNNMLNICVCVHLCINPYMYT